MRLLTMRLKPEVRKDNGYQYYVYWLLYVNETNYIGKPSTWVLFAQFNRSLLQNKARFYPPRPPILLSGCKALTAHFFQTKCMLFWATSASKYVQVAVDNMKAFHDKHSATNQWAKG